MQREVTRMPHKEPQHGTAHMYTRYKCRCAICRAAHNKRCYERVKALKGTTPPYHGTSYIYVAYACRCEECKRAYNALSTRHRQTWRAQFKREWTVQIGARVIHTKHRNSVAYVVAVEDNVCTLSKKLYGARVWHKRYLLGAPPRELKLEAYVPPVVPPRGERQAIKRPWGTKKG